MPTYTQDNRAMRISSPLGDNVLLLEAFEGSEAISTPFLFTASLLSEKPDLAPADLLRKPVGIAMATGSGRDRYFHGLVRRFSQLGRIDALTTYRMEIVPAFWFATLSADCRVFQKMSVLEIIELLFGEVGITDFAVRTTKSYPKREYCVQYRESHFAFISRLMEEEGIFYFFDHQATKHVMVLADGTSAIKPCPAQAKVRVTAEAKAPMGEDVVLTWEKAQEIRTGKVKLTDYNFTQPSLNLLATADGAGALERFDYPGQYETLDEGQRYATLQLEGAEAGGTTVSGTGTARALTAGFKFDLTEHYRRDSNGAYLITAVQHTAKSGDYRMSNAAPFDYSNRFTAMPAATVYRPLPVTPRPRVYGTLPAVVTGPSGEEIYVDKYGRVKIQFFWDRKGKRDENSSCWVRVSTFWAGKTWGAVHIPRIGQEVVVGFLEGNPDEPLVVGSVYNAEQMPPYPLPANMTQSGIKSRSSKGGDAANFNEIRFEDKKGQELVYVHAEKDRQMVVENDNTESVGHDEQVDVAHDRTRSVGNDESISVSHDQTVSVGNDRTESVGNDEAVTVAESRSHTVGKDSTYDVGQDRARSVGRDETVRIGRDQKISVGRDGVLNIAANRTTSVGKDEKHSVSKKFVLDVGDEIVIKTGEASITMKKDGTIKIKGKDISIDGSGKINVKASSDVVIKGSQVKAN
jgi:type VI secretion system secreted protein VgrG